MIAEEILGTTKVSQSQSSVKITSINLMILSPKNPKKSLAKKSPRRSKWTPKSPKTPEGLIGSLKSLNGFQRIKKSPKEHSEGPRFSQSFLKGPEGP